jgi:hypothetical protein
MAIEEGESSSKVVVLRTKTVIKKVKDNNCYGCDCMPNKLGIGS